MGYDNADRRTSLTLPNTNNVTSAYDAASQLTSLTYKKGATVLGDLTYTYDAAGNWIKTGGAFARTTIPPALTTVSYNANNQQTTFGTNTETYDLDGNLATVTDAGNTATYSWNARNQLVSISSPGFVASFTYDSFGRRTGRTVQGAVTNYVYDGLNPVQEKAGATVTANLLTGLGIDEFFTRADGVGVRSLLPDALGSTVALGDNTGTLQTQYTYEPFGYATQTGLASASSYKYTGREDDGTGLYYYRARYYHPRLQRFIGEDPIGFAGGDTNLYAYAGNSPLNLDDPFGLAACLCPMSPNSQTLQAIAAIIYNETSSLSGPGILDARMFIAHVIVNRRNAGVTGGVAPSQLSRSARSAISNGDPSANLSYAQSLLASSVVLDGCDPDPTCGARYFNFRPNASLNPFYGQSVQTQVGPLNNSAPSPGLPASGIDANTYGR